MTLINYLNRVHFADNILEEALWGELERDAPRTVLIISDISHMAAEMAERFRAGVPSGTLSHDFTDAPNPPTEDAALQLAKCYRDTGCDTIIGFGPGNAIDLTKLVRLLVSHDLPLSAFSVTEGGTHRITHEMPKMIAVPTLRGFASGLNGLASATLRGGSKIDIVSRNIIPTVTICDPTLTVDAPAETHASAGVTAIAHCIEALLSPSYNPPADGIALDGLLRAIKSIQPSTKTSEPGARREIMAAGLNAALVQQNGLGLAYAISNSLESVAKDVVDSGAVIRLILPEVLRFYATGEGFDTSSLSNAFGGADGRKTVDKISALLAKLPLPDSLTEIGIQPSEIPRAAKMASAHRAFSNGPRTPRPEDVLSIMHSVQ